MSHFSSRDCALSAWPSDKPVITSAFNVLKATRGAG